MLKSDAGPASSRRERVSAAVWLRPALLLGVLLGAGALLSLTGLANPSGLRRMLQDAGAAGPVVFVLVYAACTLGPVPRNVLSIAAGALFGFWWGLPVAYLGSLLGAAAGFVLARRLGRGAVATLAGPRATALDERLARRGTETVVAARLLPVVPFTAFNYAAGLSGISGRAYGWGSALGILPGTIAYLAVGAYVWEPGGWSLWIAAGVLVLLGVAHRVRPSSRRVSRA